MVTMYKYTEKNTHTQNHTQSPVERPTTTLQSRKLNCRPEYRAEARKRRNSKIHYRLPIQEEKSYTTYM